MSPPRFGRPIPARPLTPAGGPRAARGWLLALLGFSALAQVACTPNTTFFTTSNPIFLEGPHANDPEPNLQWPDKPELVPEGSERCTQAKTNVGACGNYHLAILEFDDLGQLREPAQLLDAKRMLKQVRKRLKAELDAGGERDSLTLIFFTHGWKHYPNVLGCEKRTWGPDDAGSEQATGAKLAAGSATPAGAGDVAAREDSGGDRPNNDVLDNPKNCRSDMERFRIFLHALSSVSDKPQSGSYEDARQGLKRSHIVGVFLTWRGAPMRRQRTAEKVVGAVPNLFSFFTRSRAASRIGGQGASYTDAIYELSSLARKSLRVSCPADDLDDPEQKNDSDPKYFSIVDHTCTGGEMSVIPRATVIAIGHSLGAKITELAIGPSLIAGTKVRSATSEPVIQEIQSLQRQATDKDSDAESHRSEALLREKRSAELEDKAAGHRLKADQARRQLERTHGPLSLTDLDELVANREAGRDRLEAEISGARREQQRLSDELKRQWSDLRAKNREVRAELSIKFVTLQRAAERLEHLLDKSKQLQDRVGRAGAPCKEASKSCAEAIRKEIIQRISSSALCSHLVGRENCAPRASTLNNSPLLPVDANMTLDELVAPLIGVQVKEVEAMRSAARWLAVELERISRLEDEIQSSPEGYELLEQDIDTQRRRLAELRRKRASVGLDLDTIEIWGRESKLADGYKPKISKLEEQAEDHRDLAREARAAATDLRDDAREQASAILAIPFDLVMLINPASPALRARELRQALDSLPEELKREDEDGVAKPLLVSISSRSDRVTRIAFPLGQKIGLFFRPFHSVKDFRADLTATAPHRSDLRSHGICLAEDEIPPECKNCKACDSSAAQELYQLNGKTYRLKKQGPANAKIGPYWIIDEAAGLIDSHSDALSNSMIQIIIGLLGKARAFEIPNPEDFFAKMKAANGHPPEDGSPAADTSPDALAGVLESPPGASPVNSFPTGEKR